MYSLTQEEKHYRKIAGITEQAFAEQRAQELGIDPSEPSAEVLGLTPDEIRVCNVGGFAYTEYAAAKKKVG